MNATINGKLRISGERIVRLEEGEIFVFGSNLRGAHSAGAALQAQRKHGAIYGQGSGLMGDSYGIPTKDRNIQTMRIDQIEPHVSRFIKFAKQHPELKFLVTEIGTGLAGLKHKDVAPLFKDALVLENVYLPQKFLNYLV